MSEVVIKAENISKRYRLGLQEKKADTFAGQLINLAKSPITNFKRLTSLSKFGENDDSVFWALKDINFEVKKGEVLGIVGKNGAGKSTLLKILSRITEPTSGNIMIKGRVSSLLEVGTGFHPELSGRENIYMNGTILGMTKKEIDIKLEEIVDFSGVAKHIDTPVKFYSSGMKVRLAFSVAAHLEPEILIIDEVLAVGDAEFQKKCLGKMENVAGQGRTVLFVSHNMAAVKSLCHEGIVLSNGFIQFKGNANDAVQNYLTSAESSISSEATWTEDNAPGDERLKLLNVKVKPTTGNDLNVASGITIEFICQNFLKNTSVDVTFEINTEDNILLVYHGNYVDKPKKLSEGLYKISAQIDPFILNKGVYYLNVLFGLQAREVLLKVNDIVRFELNDSKIDHIIKSLPGLLKPKVSYSSEVIKDLKPVN